MKKLASYLIALCMVFTILAPTALAEGNDPVSVSDLSGLQSAVAQGKDVKLAQDIEITAPTTLANATIDAGAYRLVIKADTTLNNVSITANSPAGSAPVSIVTSGVVFTADGLTIQQNSTATGAGFATCAQAMQVKKQDGQMPSNLTITLKNSSLQTVSANSRGLVFEGSSDNSKLVLDNTKIQCGAQDQWKGERGIALFDQKAMDIEIRNHSIISGYKYGINAGHTSGVVSENIDVTVDNSTIIGWGAFNIWSSNCTFTIQNGSIIRGINGSFNGDKKYGFSTIVINDDIYNNGWGTAVQNSIIIKDSTIEAVTRDGQPEQNLIRIDNAQNTLLSIQGNTKLIKDNGTTPVNWDIALNNMSMDVKADMDRFITENMEVEDSVTTQGLRLFAMSFDVDNSGSLTNLTEYIKVKVVSEDGKKGTVSSNLDANRLVAVGSDVQVSAQPADGYVFNGWYDENGTLLSDEMTTTLPIEETVSQQTGFSGTYAVTARFEQAVSDVVLVPIDPTAPVDEVTIGITDESAADTLSSTVEQIVNGENTEYVDADTLSAVQAVLEQGDQIRIESVIDPLAPEDVPAQAQAQIAQNLPANSQIAQYLDLSFLLVSEQSNEVLGELSHLKAPVSFTIAIPENLSKEGRIFQVMRVHDGKVDLLPTVQNEDGTLSFESDRFSVYALVYTDSTGGQTNPETENSNTNGATINPQTSDPAQTGLWTTLLVISIAGVVSTMCVRRSKQHD